MRLIHELNSDQLSGLSNLCFDLSKASLLLALFPAVEIITHPFLTFIRTIIGLSLGLVFTYTALVLLKYKGAEK